MSLTETCRGGFRRLGSATRKATSFGDVANPDIPRPNAPAVATVRGLPVRRTRSPQPRYDIRLEGQIYEPHLAAERRFAAEVAAGRHVVGPTVEHLQEVVDGLTALVAGMALQDSAQPTGDT
jgi:hypothetical protein